MYLCRWEQYERHGTGDPGCDIREGIMFCANGDLDLLQGIQFWEAVGKGTSRTARVRHILSAENPEEGRCRNADDQLFTPPWPRAGQMVIKPGRFRFSVPRP